MKMLPVAILAGGLGTRLLPVTEVIPKALVEINGIPFLLHQLKLLEAKGIKKVVICLGHMGEKIVEYVKEQVQLELDVVFSFDGDCLKGTAGALKQALNLLEENFFVLYGDSYLDCDYYSVQKFFFGNQKQGLMTVYHNDNQWDSSNVEYHDAKIIAYDKKNKTDRMKHIDYGLSIFNQIAFQSVFENTSTDLLQVYQTLLQQNELAAYEVSNRFYEMGSVTGLQELSSHLLEK